MLETNRQFGHYRVQSPLGVGGMGEVYLAEDTRLNRKVALKILPETIAKDVDRLRRFEQEAYAASALNHPNILTIYEFGAESDVHFLATEFVEGGTLREKLNHEGVSLVEALDIAAQIAFALSAAHAAGIVHRDIKPENIMIRTDGIVKVLDFGLAKLTEKREASADADAETRAFVKTNPGVVMGTVAYMSPEQARGKKTDERTDIWSLGICLYEMLAHKMPFTGETTNDIIAAILTREPSLLVHYVEDAPAELQRIVGKTLRKNCEERYQHSKDLQIDLKDLKQELEFEAKMERSAAPDAKHISRAADAPTQTITRDKLTDNQTVALSTKNELEANSAHNAPTTSSAEYIVNQFKRHKWQTALAAFGVLALVAGVWAAYRWLGGAGKSISIVPFQNAQISILPDSAKMENTAISPDGKYVAFVLYNDAGKNSIAVRQLATGSTVELVPPTEKELRSPTYSLDGTYLYYFLSGQQQDNLTLFRIPAFGGSASPRKIIERIDTVISFAPDGRRFTFLRWNKDESRTLMIADAEGASEQPLLTDTERGIKLSVDPIWSPDGQKIIVSVSSNKGNESDISYIEVSVADGSFKPFGNIKFKAIHDNFWLKDGSGLIFNGFETDTAYSQIYHLSYPGGELRRLTNDVNEYGDFSISADNSMMLATRGETLLGLSRYNPATKEFVQIFPETSGNFGSAGFALLSDGKIIHTRARGIGGVVDLWVADADGKNARQVVTDARLNINPILSPDGRFIIFHSNRTGFPKLWRMDAGGNNPVQLTNNEDYEDYDAQITPDGETIVFVRNKIGDIKASLMRLPFEGGEAVSLPNEDDSQSKKDPRISPDGKRLAYLAYNHETNKTFLKLASFDGTNLGKPEKEFDWDKRGKFVWSPDGKSITYQESKDGKANLWQLPLDGGAAKPKQLTFFTTNYLGAFAWMPDNKQLLVTPGNYRSELVLIKDAAAQNGAK